LTLAFIQLVFAEDDSRTKRLVNAWQGKKGVLIHVAKEEWAISITKAINSSEPASFFVDTDCGPMYSAWSLAAKGIPMALAVMSQLGLMIDANSNFSQDYVQSLYPSDAATDIRQFCAQPDTIMTGPSLSQYGPKNITTLGCPEHDEDCKFIAAGVSPGLGQ